MRVVNILPRAAGALAPDRRAVVVKLQRDADDVIALFGQERRRDGTVDAARHGHHDARVARGFIETEGVHGLNTRSDEPAQYSGY